MSRKIVFLKDNTKLEVVNSAEVIDSMIFSDDLDRILTKEIIRDIEFRAGETIRDNKTVLIPYIGKLSKSAVKKEFKKEIKYFKLVRPLMTKEEYKNYVKEAYLDCIHRVRSEEKKKVLRHKIISGNRKHYDYLYKTVGEVYANTWIYSLLLIHPIEFNQDVEDAFKRLNDETEY